MASEAKDEVENASTPLRVAVEGCGHGTLDAIYASVQKSCEIKGWDGVDLVIIGGDFQAVRDRKDLNVTAMPAKYRTMADFHQYYWGTKTAPYLTVFIGGNHEASNHLFELYYGGWVAPNIYYLGAANVIQVGPLKIAGMSGIWKGYDYRRPHFERLPYSSEEMYGIYHVRELDVRKLLAFRSQVDIGMSHDWPKGIEWLGDHERLFKHKPHLQEDAQSGRLGNTAAQQVLDRLRPQFWFSAHLHTKYVALKSHVQKKSQKTVDGAIKEQKSHPVAHEQQLSAWNSFGERARSDEAKESARLMEQGRLRREEAERTGVPLTANYNLQETYKKVTLGDGFERGITSISNEEKQGTSTNHHAGSIPQLDGCFASSLKRRRDSSSSPNNTEFQGTKYAALGDGQAEEALLSTLDGAGVANPDAIDIDMSDDETTQLTAGTQLQALESVDSSRPSEESKLSRDHDDSKNSANEQVLGDVFSNKETPLNAGKDANGTFLDDDVGISQPHIPNHVGAPEAANVAAQTTNEVSEEMRTQLAALSSKFEEPVQASPSLPHPEEITNETTKFLALSKCEDRQNFLQLLEISPYKPTDQPIERPVKIRYVPEWLAILRVFAPELALGGRANDPIPPNRGDTFYRDRILEEENWIQERVVAPGLLDVPRNFSQNISSQYGAEAIDSQDMPREVTNPQTSAFCNLIGIDNLFDISEEARDARMAAGPAESASSGHRGRGGHSRGGRGGRGGGGHPQRGGSSRGGRGRSGNNWGGRGRGRN